MQTICRKMKNAQIFAIGSLKSRLQKFRREAATSALSDADVTSFMYFHPLQTPARQMPRPGPDVGKPQRYVPAHFFTRAALLASITVPPIGTLAGGTPYLTK